MWTLGTWRTFWLYVFIASQLCHRLYVILLIPPKECQLILSRAAIEILEFKTSIYHDRITSHSNGLYMHVSMWAYCNVCWVSGYLGTLLPPPFFKSSLCINTNEFYTHRDSHSWLPALKARRPSASPQAPLQVHYSRVLLCSSMTELLAHRHFDQVIIS